MIAPNLVNGNPQCIKMPRIRYIKPDFFQDEDLANLSFEGRLFFEGLWCWADRKGRLEYRPKFLKGQIFPYDNLNISELIECLEHPKIENRPEKQFIKLYEISGKKYIQILEFEKHQKPHHTEKNSTIPAINALLTVKQPSINGKNPPVNGEGNGDGEWVMGSDQPSTAEELFKKLKKEI